MNECKYYKEFDEVIKSNEIQLQQKDIKIITYPYCTDDKAKKHGLSKDDVYGVTGGNSKLKCKNNIMKCDIDKLENKIKNK